MTSTSTWPRTVIRRLNALGKSQTRYSSIMKWGTNKAVPTHWSLMFGEVAIYSFVVLLLTGAFLTFFYTPSMETVRYQGSYAPLIGVEMSRALHSTLDLSFDVRGGLLMRQAHHWAGLLFMVALVMHILRVFFTGAFRKPRQAAWVVLIGIFLASLATGLTGYILPDDMLSGLSLLIMDGTFKAIPVIGSSLSYFVFGGPYPGQVILSRLTTLHVLILPLGIISLAAVRAALALLHKPMQFPGPGCSDRSIVGEPLLPTRAAKSAGFMFVLSGFILLIGGTATINPIWLYGPSDPGNAGAGSQPDWYFGFIDGALRLVPPGWEITVMGGTVSLALLAPMTVVGLFLLAVTAYPFLERWISADTTEHHLLERPRNNPTRTAIGAAGLGFVGVLWAAGSADVAARALSLALEDLLHAYQVLLVLGPVMAFAVTRRVCLALQRKDREIVIHGRETGRIVRLPHGEFVEVHQPVTAYERWKLVSYDPSAPLHPAASGDSVQRRSIVQRLRMRASGWFFEYRMDPATPAQLGKGPAELYRQELSDRLDAEALAPTPGSDSR
ncbi:cytochrome bc complex cytochrome b subunit [Arthrobacter sp. MSA 4-2]|uniref:cytochrome bc1 complex cytochrome b subunit n=1 Tax=Arthrobacter sp. MSA 4-2 TaxID=2794349 RepID=UPI0018E7FC20|nr:cytochrome b N-terminal domain-containing protein [Arthrobacter sp. MSA 4-2]MBJ2121494.1 cytochrome bc complex cytochrome b subunit [Arthrobacter sp. MSA 4-2]